MANELMPTTKIAVFRKKEIRKTIHNNQWWFVIVDVVAALTDSAQPDGYIKDMRRRDGELAKGWGQIATPLSVQTTGGGPRAEKVESRAGEQGRESWVESRELIVLSLPACGGFWVDS